MIRIDHLNKYFNKGKQNEIHVINDISLELPERGMVAVFGRSGCGKTTLLNVIGGLDRFSGGTLTVDGQNIREDTDTLRNREMGYIFQNYNLNKGESCYDNVADALRLLDFPEGWQMRERVEAALANVGMENFANRTPDTLSGGQQQRIAIARAIVKNPRIILADEPTGNLDEANTLLVMDLLKEIARDHLVLLVTHEAELVDHYCDTVIELSDGKVVNVRNNTNAGGLRAKDKNDIYLGELKHETAENGLCTVDYYGDAPQTPVRVRVVNSGGKLYLRVDTAGVQILDDTSEVHLREGVFEAHLDAKRDRERVDMSKLPPVAAGRRTGRLYTFRSAVRSGWRANFSKKRKGKKFLLVLMTLFSSILVLMTSLFGVSLRTLFEARDANSRNMFYLYTPADGDVSERLLAALNDPSTGIDDLTVNRGTFGDRTYTVNSGYFETFQNRSYSGGSNPSAHAVPLDRALADGKKLLAGRTTELSATDAILSSAMADLLLKSSTVGYLRSYGDLIGLSTAGLNIIDPATGKSRQLCIAGVVEGAESAFYLDPVARAQISLRNMGARIVLAPAVDYKKDIPAGSVVLCASSNASEKQLPRVGSEVMLRGMKLTVQEIIRDDQYYLPQAVVSPADYTALSRRDGKSDELFTTYSRYEPTYEEPIKDEKYGYSRGTTSEVQPLSVYRSSDMDYGWAVTGYSYSEIHSSDPDKTEAWLKSNFGDLTAPDQSITVLRTPDDLYENALSQNLMGMIASFVSMGVVLVILCICIYFIMRSSLMKGIKEVGIYRAIGVTKKNLIFRFFIESAVLTALTTLVGFLLSSAVMRLWLRATPLMANIFYYPIWLSGVLLFLIVGVCLLCGVLPAATLLRKTPSEILAKYDI